MKSRKVLDFGWLFSFLLVWVILWPIDFVQAQEGTKVYDKTNYQEIRHLLIPALEQAVKRGDFILRVGNLDFPLKHWDYFMDESQKNEGKYGLSKKGHLIDPKTGGFPRRNIYGFPFPTIDPKDPEAAIKIIWNFNFQKYRFMGQTHQGSRTPLIDEKGAHRILAGAVSLMFYQGRMPGKRIDNPKGYLSSYLNVTKSPMDMNGVNSLTHEFIEEDKDSVVFNYLPVIRRVRQTTGTGRSDPVFGTDGCLDYYLMFSGKVATFKWKFLGEKEILTYFTHTRKDMAKEDPDGTFHRVLYSPKIGYDTPGWEGASWATAEGVWIPRQVWVIEAENEDPYYNLGKWVMYVDKELYTMWLSEVFDKSGSFWQWNIFRGHYTEGPSGNNTIGDPDGLIHIDEKIRHATWAYYTPENGGGTCFMPAEKHGLDIYTNQNMIFMSK